MRVRVSLLAATVASCTCRRLAFAHAQVRPRGAVWQSFHGLFGLIAQHFQLSLYLCKLNTAGVTSGKAAVFIPV